MYFTPFNVSVSNYIPVTWSFDLEFGVDTTLTGEVSLGLLTVPPDASRSQRLSSSPASTSHLPVPNLLNYVSDTLQYKLFKTILTLWPWSWTFTV